MLNIIHMYTLHELYQTSILLLIYIWLNSSRRIYEQCALFMIACKIQLSLVSPSKIEIKEHLSHEVELAP